MTKIDNKYIKEINNLIQDITEMEAWIEELFRKIETEVLPKIAEQIDENQKDELIKYLYWKQPKLSSTIIAKGLGYKNVGYIINKHGEHETDVMCDRCEKPIKITKRNQLKDMRNNGFVVLATIGDKTIYSPWRKVCKECLKQIFKERANYGKSEDEVSKFKEYIESQKKYYENELEIQRNLKTMPYQDYLKTSHWQERRQRHLQSAGYRCQICNSNDDILDVHHRTYERRGSELFTDLIVLCRDCHNLFHKSQKIKKD